MRYPGYGQEGDGPGGGTGPGLCPAVWTGEEGGRGEHSHCGPAPPCHPEEGGQGSPGALLLPGNKQSRDQQLRHHCQVFNENQPRLTSRSLLQLC